MIENGEADRRKVLVVDDDQEVVDMVVTMLDFEDRYSVTAYYDSQEALADLEKQRPDVVVTDLMMPGISGLDLTRKIRGTRGMEGIPVVMITAAVDLNRQMMREAGVTEILAKPFDMNQLLLCIREAVNGRSLPAA